jgi:hypothetical protein
MRKANCITGGTSIFDNAALNGGFCFQVRGDKVYYPKLILYHLGGSYFRELFDSDPRVCYIDLPEDDPAAILLVLTLLGKSSGYKTVDVRQACAQASAWLIDAYMLAGRFLLSDVRAQISLLLLKQPPTYKILAAMKTSKDPNHTRLMSKIVDTPTIDDISHAPHDMLCAVIAALHVKQQALLRNLRDRIHLVADSIHPMH